MEDLEQQLIKATEAGTRFKLIVTDGVFSMDGLVAPLDKICDLADKYDALVMVDECHAAGFIGATGKGTLEAKGVMGRVDIITGTLGKATAPEEILKMAVSQKPFFGKKGGITFSGGEPTFQAKALVPLFRMLKEAGIHICVDTNGGIWNEDVKELLSLADLVLLDVKEFNDERHKALTARSNAQTLKTAAWLEENQKPFWLRYVLVQKYSYFKEDIEALGEHFKNYRMIERVEILPYHTLGVHKYEAMKLDYQLKDVKLNT
jgi:pyruvate formate lyase activating enzyme